MNRKAALADRIVDFCRLGRIPPKFRTQHVREHFSGQYSEKHIMTVLPNFAEGGYWVKKGMKARFRRVDGERGLYELAPRLEGSSSDRQREGREASSRILTAEDLGKIRRQLIQLLNHIEKKPASRSEGVGRRISRLRDENALDRNIANWMHTILNARGGTEYEGHKLSPNESNAIRSAWDEVLDWAKLKGWKPD